MSVLRKVESGFVPSIIAFTASWLRIGRNSMLGKSAPTRFLSASLFQWEALLLASQQVANLRYSVLIFGPRFLEPFPTLVLPPFSNVFEIQVLLTNREMIG